MLSQQPELQTAAQLALQRSVMCHPELPCLQPRLSLRQPHWSPQCHLEQRQAHRSLVVLQAYLQGLRRPLPLRQRERRALGLRQHSALGLLELPCLQLQLWNRQPHWNLRSQSQSRYLFVGPQARSKPLQHLRSWHQQHHLEEQLVHRWLAMPSEYLRALRHRLTSRQRERRALVMQ